MGELIYKICRESEWAAAQAPGEYKGSAADAKDGFIHFSTAAQAPKTAAKHFKGDVNLVLVAVDSAKFGPELKWEPARDGDLFPHLYASLPVDAAVSVNPLPLGADGAHVFPSGFGQ
jgi:uncharacterized protein (DUF952 family)